MKLRIMGDSLRFRLSQSEVARLRHQGAVADSVDFGLGAGGKLDYELRSVAGAPGLTARLSAGLLLVEAPEAAVERWADTDEVGLEGQQPVTGLRILIQKDFTCLVPRQGEEDRDTFPNPAARS